MRVYNVLSNAHILVLSHFQYSPEECYSFGHILELGLVKSKLLIKDRTKFEHF